MYEVLSSQHQHIFTAYFTGFDASLALATGCRQLFIIKPTAKSSSVKEK